MYYFCKAKLKINNNKLTGFYMKATLAFNGLSLLSEMQGGGKD